MKCGVLMLVLCLGFCFGQNPVITGTVSDSLGPVSFAGIWCAESHTGVVANEAGQFNIILPNGSKTLQFRALGYATQTLNIVNLKVPRITITLHPESYTLNEIEILSGDDPAVAIIQRALQKQPQYLQQTSTYSCNTYIKGLQHIDRIPKNASRLVSLSKGSIRDTQALKGTVYLSESISQYHSAAPNDEKEIMISSKLSGNNRSFSFNNYSGMKLNLYKPFLSLGAATERPIISPLNAAAFSYYRFFLKGTFTENGQRIHKIKVVPISKNEPCVYGHMYIHDSTWQVCGYEMVISKARQLQFADTLELACRYVWLPDDLLWMPQLQELRFNFNVFGFKGSGYFIASLTQYKINPETVKGFFNAAAIEIQNGSNTKDSTYWNAQRPIPLTHDERADYRRKDSVFAFEQQTRVMDSVDRIKNRFKPLCILTGYTWQKRSQQVSYNVFGLLDEGWQFNTVEGHHLGTEIQRLWRDSTYREHESALQLSYAFALKRFNISGYHQFLYNPLKNSSIKIVVQNGVQSFQPLLPFFKFQNTWYSLFAQLNYLKLYWSRSLKLVYESEWSNYCFFKGRFSFEERSALQNTDLSTWYKGFGNTYMSNAPFHPNNNNLIFKTQYASIQELEWTFRFKQRYIALPHLKINNGSPYPKVQIGFKSALPLNKDWAQFIFTRISLWHTFKLNRFGMLQCRAESGTFLNAKNTGLMDYKHFYGNLTVFQNLPIDGFRNTPYFVYSTLKPYLQWHSELHLKGLLLDKVPVLNRLNVQEVLGFHSLYIQDKSPLTQVVLGIEKIAKIFRVDVTYTLQQEPSRSWYFNVGLVQPF